MAEPIALVSGRPDADVAADLKRRVTDKLRELCAIYDEAKDAGFMVNHQLGVDYAGKWQIVQLTIAKLF